MIEIYNRLEQTLMDQIEELRRGPGAYELPPIMGRKEVPPMRKASKYSIKKDRLAKNESHPKKIKRSCFNLCANEVPKIGNRVTLEQPSRLLSKSPQPPKVCLDDEKRIGK